MLLHLILLEIEAMDNVDSEAFLITKKDGEYKTRPPKPR